MQSSTSSEVRVQSWFALADAIERTDEDRGFVHEDLMTNAIWCSVAYLPGVAVELGLEAGVSWHRGGRGQADIVSEDAKLQLEVKGPNTKVSFGSSCPTRCGLWLSQFEHIAEDPDVRLTLVTHRRAVSRYAERLDLLKFTTAPGFFSFTEVADMMRRSLATHRPLREDAIACLFDVEDR